MRSSDSDHRSQCLVHTDPWLLVVDKPAGVLSVRGRGPDGEDCVHARLQREWPDAMIVHRLDMATSGVMVFARGAQAQRYLSRAFERRAVNKRYVAVVAGRLSSQMREPDHGEDTSNPAIPGWNVIDLPLIADWPNRPRQKVDHAVGRPSRTLWRPLSPADGPWGEGTRVELSPITGRSHQLRVHLMAIGHPIVGDALYAPDRVASAAPRLLLHATRLAVPHPADGRPMSWQVAARF